MIASSNCEIKQKQVFICDLGEQLFLHIFWLLFVSWSKCRWQLPKPVELAPMRLWNGLRILPTFLQGKFIRFCHFYLIHFWDCLLKILCFPKSVRNQDKGLFLLVQTLPLYVAIKFCTQCNVTDCWIGHMDNAMHFTDSDETNMNFDCIYYLGKNYKHKTAFATVRSF